MPNENKFVCPSTVPSQEYLRYVATQKDGLPVGVRPDCDMVAITDSDGNLLIIRKIVCNNDKCSSTICELRPKPCQ